ncbi:hypothetical protein GCM10010915_22420 [Microbacterium faecale]|uniref:Acetone carboxylase n=1 Tax=Microbacterium faecale TaxID=1804630 RepID=A0A916YE03_9MICO|nr:hypothetical protein GCM10010915_22420 [Microbacterium faecale]
MILGFAPDSPQCARAECRAPAEMSVVWRNPKIHTPDRRKVWLACAEHADYLHDFLASRAFPVRVVDDVTDGSDVDLPEGPR